MQLAHLLPSLAKGASFPSNAPPGLVCHSLQIGAWVLSGHVSYVTWTHILTVKIPWHFGYPWVSRLSEALIKEEARGKLDSNSGLRTMSPVLNRLPLHPCPLARSWFLSTVTWKSASSQNLSVQVKEEAKYNEWLRRQALAEEEEEERRNAARKLDLHRQLDAQVVEKSQNVFEQKADVREERQAVDNIIQQVQGLAGLYHWSFLLVLSIRTNWKHQHCCPTFVNCDIVFKIWQLN